MCCPRDLPMTMHNSSILTVFLAKELSSPFFLTYFYGLAFHPQLVHFFKFFNCLCFLFHQVILLHSNFFCLAAFLRMFFSGISFLLFHFFALPYSFLYFSVGCPFSLVSSFGYFLLIWFILFHPPTTLFSIFFLVYSICCST